MNETFQTIHNRRSIRAFTAQSIPPTIKESIIQAALRSPTAGNMMLYSIIEAEDQILKDTLAKTCDNQPFIAQSPFVLIFLADYQRWQDYFQLCNIQELCSREHIPAVNPREGNFLLACCDAVIAAQTAVLAAESLGIGSCYIGDIMENYETHRELLDLPSYVFPITMVCFGYPAEQQKTRKLATRFGQEYIVHKNRYRQLKDDEFKAMYQPLQEEVFSRHSYLRGAVNIGQHYYLKKMVADFSLEMNRSARAALESWQEK